MQSGNSEAGASSSLQVLAVTTNSRHARTTVRNWPIHFYEFPSEFLSGFEATCDTKHTGSQVPGYHSSMPLECSQTGTQTTLKDSTLRLSRSGDSLVRAFGV